MYMCNLLKEKISVSISLINVRKINFDRETSDFGLKRVKCENLLYINKSYKRLPNPQLISSELPLLDLKYMTFWYLILICCRTIPRSQITGLIKTSDEDVSILHYISLISDKKKCQYVLILVIVLSSYRDRCPAMNFMGNLTETESKNLVYWTLCRSWL
jgi:hypothetical protein